MSLAAFLASCTSAASVVFGWGMLSFLSVWKKVCLSRVLVMVWGGLPIIGARSWSSASISGVSSSPEASSVASMECFSVSFLASCSSFCGWKVSARRPQVLPGCWLMMERTCLHVWRRSWSP